MVRSRIGLFILLLSINGVVLPVLKSKSLVSKLKEEYKNPRAVHKSTTEQTKLIAKIKHDMKRTPAVVKDYVTVFGSRVFSWKDSRKRTLLVDAIMNNRSRDVQALVLAGAPLDITVDKRKTTPLMLAIRKRNKAIISALSLESNILMTNDEGKTALDMVKSRGRSDMLAIIEGSVASKLVRRMLGDDNKVLNSFIQQYGLDILSFKNPKGQTALMVAAKKGHFSVVRKLIEEGASLDVQDNDGMSLLMHAVGRDLKKLSAEQRNDQLCIVKTILYAFPDLFLKTNNGLTARDVALRAKNNHFVALIDTFVGQLAQYEGMHDLEQKEIVVVIPSYLNEKWTERCLKTIANQDYHNFTVVFCDDCSPDGTFAKAQAFVDKYKLHDKFILQHNERRCGKAANMVRILHNFGRDYGIADDALVVIIDGDDYLAHPYVFKYLNKIYQEKDIWHTYGGYVDYIAASRGFDRPTDTYFVRANDFRSSTQNTSQLRTFYAKVFREIKVSDFIYRGTFAQMSSDLIVGFPMFELAGHRYYHTDLPFYMYNRETPINDDKVSSELQGKLDRFSRTRPRYKALKNLDVHDVIPTCAVINLDQVSSVEELLTQLAQLDVALIGLETNERQVNFNTYRAAQLMHVVDATICASCGVPPINETLTEGFVVADCLAQAGNEYPICYAGTLYSKERLIKVLNDNNPGLDALKSGSFVVNHSEDCHEQYCLWHV